MCRYSAGESLLGTAMDRFIIKGQLVQADADQWRICVAEVQPAIGLIAIQDASGLPYSVNVLALFGL